MMNDIVLENVAAFEAEVKKILKEDQLDNLIANMKPEPFTVTSALLAVEELYEAIPKSRRAKHIGALNEVMWVLEQTYSQTGVS